MLQRLLLVLVSYLAACNPGGSPVGDMAITDLAQPADLATPDLTSPDLALAPIPVPTDFKRVAFTKGTDLYLNDYAGMPGYSPDWVLVTDLSRARVLSFTGPVTGMEMPMHPVLLGPNSLVTKLTMSDLVLAAKGLEPNLFALFNGQFFDTGRAQTPLVFTVKQGGSTISVGNNMLTDPAGPKRLVRIDNTTAHSDIVLFTPGTFDADIAPYDVVIGALDETANKSPASYVPRTFVGVGAAGQRFYTYCSLKSNQPDAAKLLRDFGATDVAMLDGGGSSQLWVEGIDRVAQTRLIPHGIGVVPRP